MAVGGHLVNWPQLWPCKYINTKRGQTLDIRIASLDVSS